MKITSQADITKIIQADPWMMQVLQAAETLDLPDWWIGAGFLRNKVWDAIEGNETPHQARMHYVNDFEPYTSTEDGIAHWVETATCVAVRLRQGSLEYLFCHGTDDLFGLVARPTVGFRSEELIHIFYDRIEKKGWRQRWPHLKVEAA